MAIGDWEINLRSQLDVAMEGCAEILELPWITQMFLMGRCYESFMCRWHRDKSSKPHDLPFCDGWVKDREQHSASMYDGLLHQNDMTQYSRFHSWWLWLDKISIQSHIRSNEVLPYPQNLFRPLCEILMQTSRSCQMTFRHADGIQIECQNICQIECQKECQIELNARMYVR